MLRHLNEGAAPEAARCVGMGSVHTTFSCFFFVIFLPFFIHTYIHTSKQCKWMNSISSRKKWDQSRPWVQG